MVEYDLIIRNGTIVDGSRFDKLGMKYDTPVHANDIPGGERRLIRQPVGLHYTLLNSVVTFEDGTCSDALPGKLLRSTDVAA